MAPRAMLLAAGFGTRLESLTTLRPKPMLPVCGRPLVEWGARWLASHGIEDVTVNLHHLGSMIEEHLVGLDDLGLRVHFSHEEGEILGTGGGLLRARPSLDAGDGSPIVIANGKIITDIDLQAALSFHREGGFEATMVLREDREGVWKGALQRTTDGRLGALMGDELANAVLDPTPMMFTGVHIIEPSMLDRIPRTGAPCVVRTAYREAFRAGTLGAFVSSAYWWEHSTVERYVHGMVNVLSGAVTRPWWDHDLRGEMLERARAHGVQVTGPVWMDDDIHVAPGAEFAGGVQLERRCRLREGIRINRGIVWSGADVDTDFEAGVWTRAGLTGGVSAESIRR